MKITIEPSAIVGSPYKYMYIYLTDELYLGPHIIVSNAEEYGEKGIIVALHPHYEASPDEEPELCPTFEDAMNEIERLLKA